MSTINVSNITDGTDTVGTSYVLNGSAKAWALIDGSATITVLSSSNVSSATDVQVGVYEANYTSSMASKLGCYTGSSTTDLTVGEPDPGASSVSKYRTIIRTFGGGVSDDPFASVCFKGDLA
jgi:hypothetical protein